MPGRLLIILLLMASAAVRADIYKWTDADGRVHFSDNDAGQRKAEKVDVRIVTYTHVTYQKLKASPAAAATRNVTLYGTSWCGYCKKARAYFRSRNIPFTDLDVETDPGAKVQFEAMGGGGVPVILVGDTRINGFDEPAFDKIYNPH